MAQPLNKYLYDHLKRYFGSVRISNEGVKQTARDGWDSENNRPCLDILDSGEYYMVSCFAPETEVITPDGDRPIKDLVGVSTLLIPNRKGLGNWKRVEVRSFGVQSVMTIVLRRGKSVKTIRVTPDHRWLLKARSGVKIKCPYQEKPVLTNELLKGDRLISCYARKLDSYPRRPYPSSVGIMQGFVFGDGSRPSKVIQPASVSFFGSKYTDLKHYFSGCRWTQYEKKEGVERFPHDVEDLPRSWKELPNSDESLSFLFGWLAGYFAADGSVSKATSQATLWSSKREHLVFAKAICYRLGVRVSPIRKKCYFAKGKDRVGYLFSIAVRDMPVSFWIREHHRTRAAYWAQKEENESFRDWLVEDVIDKGEVAEVYCAIVPDTEKFTLADNVATMNCPYCNDTKHRLYINHKWGHEDKFGNYNRHLTICYNEGCLSHPGRVEDLMMKITATRHELAQAKILPGVKAPTPEDLVVDWPGYVIPVEDLPDTHKAVQYLRSRNFDPAFIGRFYNVHYCESSIFYLARDRLVIPLYIDKKMVGWQCRYIGEINWKGPTAPVKYYNNPNLPRRRVVYNFGNAIKYRTMVIMEGVTDVWSLGPMGVSTLGSFMSEDQRTRIVKACRGDENSAVLLYDPDVKDDKQKWPGIKKMIDKLKREMRGRFADVWLPTGRDPGSLDRTFLRQYIADEARKQKVEVSWTKRK